MEITLDRRPCADDGLVLVRCPEMFLRLFSGPTDEAAAVSVFCNLGQVSAEGGSVVVDPERLTPLVIGKPGIGVIISTTVVSAAEASPLPVPPRPRHRGDIQFTSSADHELSDNRLKEAAREILRAVRKLDPAGDLRPGENRKYVNYPDNFVGFTVQRRNQAILVHARESEALRHLTTTRSAPDRRPYIRLWVRAACDVPDAISVIEGSWRRGR